MNNEPNGYISKIEFNNGTTMEVKKDDIVVFVGPNNAGKSQSLKDIYALSGLNKNIGLNISGKVVSKIFITKKTSKISNIIETIDKGKMKNGYKNYEILGNQFVVFEYTDSEFSDNPYYGEYKDLFIANLDTETRLTICNPPKNISRKQNKEHPIHYVAFNPDYRKWLSSNFKMAFNADLIPNMHNGGTIPLCMGEPVILDGNFDDETSRGEAYAKILETYDNVQAQGDGIRSFTGILLYLMIDYFCTFLIDEPESFLHPPQARIIGQIIGQKLNNNQQAFISTHSEEIIKGLIETCPNRIKVVRITRDKEKNDFSILQTENFSDIWKDPLLKYSNIMSSLFHKSVVLCESDSDCKMYSIIDNHIKQKNGKYSETLFIHCGGKQRMAKIATALRTLNINIKLIPDIDVMNNEVIFKEIIEAFDINWSSIKSFYKIIVSNLHNDKEKIKRNDAKNIINHIIDSNSKQYLETNEINEIREAINTTSNWDSVKKHGVSAIPSGDASAAFENINNVLCAHGIFIVPVGELECFIKTVGGHGPEWTNRVLEKYPNLDDSIYKDIKDFISNMDL